ncbi:MAG: glycosyltransferase, partial [Pseudomonadota bacterium]
MKLIVQIPALNEEETIATAIAEIPRKMPGVTSVEVLVIDDGSTDKTVEVARKAGADHILIMPSNVGLARAFSAGIEEALALVQAAAPLGDRLRGLVRMGDRR